MSIVFTQNQYHHQDNVPSMEQDDNCSDTDTDTVLYTPTLQSTMYDPSSWFPPNFDNIIHPSQRPMSSPLLFNTSNYNDKSKNDMDTHSFATHRVCSAPVHHESTEDSAYSPSPDHYRTTIRRMSQHIDDFLQSRQEHTNDVPLKKSYLDNGPGPSSMASTGAMIEMIHQFRGTLHSDTTTATHSSRQAQQLCDTMLAWFQQSSCSTALDDEKKKNERLVYSIQNLAQRHYATKQAHRTEIKNIQRQQELRNQKNWTARLQQEIQTRKEAEEILDSVRMEMESMMDELNAAKQQLFTAEQESQNIRHQWESIIQQKKDASSHEKHVNGDNDEEQVDPWELLSLQQDDYEHRIDTMTDEIHRLSKENEDRHDLKRRLLKAERQAAECDLKLVVLKSQQNKQQQQQNNINSSNNSNDIKKDDNDEKDELITALQHELVEKKSALALWEKKWQQETKQWQQQQAALQQSHLTDHQVWQEEYKSECQKQQDLAFLRVTRETRALEGQLTDMSLENDRLAGCVAEHQQHRHRMEQQYKVKEATWAAKQSDWERMEKEAKAVLLALEQKVIGLEADTVRLYGKNIILAKQLGECD
ncbi:hypothetical protein BCR42DRAFT_414096 [Absidia repens]|uniref:Uncharacterized protein n=1 Tax=Absidia repens TaxID=90262 RepID=A0A1X2IIH3_9FUNG|nr:hypothetical protein BCR42DRAFT_414096 [Absidia repens]